MDLIWVWLVVDLLVGLGIGVVVHKSLTDRRIGGTEERVRRILEEGQRDADARRKAAELEAREIALRTRAELDEETRRRQRDIQQVEQRISQKDEQLA
ncbi:MAG: Rnase Y domain-containing protein, partial [Thermoanaerobaculia bacterium]